MPVLFAFHNSAPRRMCPAGEFSYPGQIADPAGGVPAAGIGQQPPGIAKIRHHMAHQKSAQIYKEPVGTDDGIARGVDSIPSGQ